MIPINFHTIVLRRKHSRTRRNDLRSAPGRSCFFFYLATGTGSVQVVSLASRTFEGRYHYSPSVTELGFHCFCWWFFLVPGENQKSSPPTMPRGVSLSLSIEPRELVYYSILKFIAFFLLLFCYYINHSYVRSKLFVLPLLFRFIVISLIDKFLSYLLSGNSNFVPIIWFHN